MTQNSPSFVFFGTPRFAVLILDELLAAGLTPSLVVTAPDKPAGRGLILTAPAVKAWAIQHGIPFIQPQTLKELPAELTGTRWDFFVVAAYGKILRKNILDLPAHGTLNVHPSLLPKFRGPSPIESSILADEKDTGVSIMLLDEEVDHGPILKQMEVALRVWPPKASELEDILGREGGKLLAEVIPRWVLGEIEAAPQNHSQATFTRKISKEDGLLDLSSDSYKNFLKIQALEGWPGTYFFVERAGKKVRVKITEAKFLPAQAGENEVLEILKVIPEGKREMSYQEFLRGK